MPSPVDLRRDAKTAIRDAVTSAGGSASVKFRGEALPTSGDVVVLDLLSAEDLPSLERRSADAEVRVQVGAYAPELSRASRLLWLARGTLETLGWITEGAARPVPRDAEGFEGMQQDFVILASQEG